MCGLNLVVKFYIAYFALIIVGDMNDYVIPCGIFTYVCGTPTDLME